MSVWLYKSSSRELLAYVLLLVALWCVPLLLGQPQWGMPSGVTPLSELLLAGLPSYVSQLLVLLVLLLIPLVIRSFFINTARGATRSWLLLLLYPLVATASGFGQTNLLPVTTALLCVLVACAVLLSASFVASPGSAIFRAAFFMGIAPLFYAPVIFLFPLLLIALLRSGTIDLKTLLLTIAGLVVFPGATVFVCYLLDLPPQSCLPDFATLGLSFDGLLSDLVAHPVVAIFWTFLLLLWLPAIMQSGKSQVARNASGVPVWSLVRWSTGLLLLSGLFAPKWPEVALFVSLPVSVAIVHYCCQNAKSKRLATVLHLLLLYAVVLHLAPYIAGYLL